MENGHTICVGTVGAGVWYSSDSGARWRRSRMKLPFHAEPGEIQIRSLVVSPHDPNVVYAGSEVGLYRSQDKGAVWDLIESPADGKQIWSIAVHPDDPNVILFGTKPPCVFRTRDGGQTWEELPLNAAERCLAGAPKVTNLLFDPRDSGTVWASVEIDGIYRSTDGGDTWEHLPALGESELNQDIHGLTISPDPHRKIIATTPDGIWTSTDEGQSWALHGFPRFSERGISYCRGVALKADDPNVMFVGNGDFIPGKVGAIQRSTDGGHTWQAAPLPTVPNSTMYWFATNPADPDFIVANSLHGYVYTSQDGGASWNKSEREFGEVRALAWVPN